MHARDALGDWALHEGDRRVTNIVMMGMGEPLYNADNVIQALQLMTDGDGIAISRRRVMLSTAGVVPEIPRAGRETGVRLAVSLHAVTDELRDILVPINRKYPLEQLLRAVRDWPDLGGAGGRVTWEYVMLRDVNDSPADARALVSLIRGIPSKINLIPFNPWPGSPYERSRPDVIQRFADILWNAGYSSPVRTPRGQDILAACGQLKTATLRQRRRSLAPAAEPAPVS
jgi:23S rRNA (adenine2503-C2)-methyltransferase